MSWFTRKDKGILTPTESKREAPDGLWYQCPSCKKAMHTREHRLLAYTCSNCGYHEKIGSQEYFELLFDETKYTELDAMLSSGDPLNFVDTKKYPERIKATEKKTGLKDACRTAVGKMEGSDIVISAMDFSFIGGSMGSVVGEKIARGITYALEHKIPFMMISKSGGARMMEAGFSLMQMAKTSAKLALLAEAGIPYISLLTDPTTGLATGVSYVDTVTMTEKVVRGKTVILAASAGETARLLLNSKSSRFPNGLANSSGVVGRYINDSTGASRSAIVPALFDRKRYNEDGVGGMHVYTPWWLDNKKLDFPRGYHIEYGGGMGMPAYGFGWGIEGINEKYPTRDGIKKAAGGYGATLKEDYRRFYGAYIGMAGRGEPVPDYNNYCEIDPNVVDKFGIPVLRFNYKWSDYEIKQAKHMQDTFEQIIHEMGGEALGKKPDAKTNYGLAEPGKIIHEVGTARMGNDPKKSVLNSNCQAHDVKNLFVADAAPFVSQGDKNATWTILALSARTSNYIIEQKKKGAL